MPAHGNPMEQKLNLITEFQMVDLVFQLGSTSGSAKHFSGGTARIRTHRVQMGRGFPATASFRRVSLLCPQICQFPTPDVPPTSIDMKEISKLISA